MDGKQQRSLLGNGHAPKPPAPRKKGRPPDRIPNDAADIIYQAYPKHVSKGPALKAIRKALAKVEFTELLAAVQEYAISQAGNETQYIPYPATWFNQEKWADDRSLWTEWQRRNGMVRTVRDVDSILQMVRSQFPTADEAWRIVREAAIRMEPAYSPNGNGERLAANERNKAIAAEVDELPRSIAESMRWSRVRFGKEDETRREFCRLYNDAVRAKVNREVVPKLLGRLTADDRPASLPREEQLRRLEDMANQKREG